ADQDLLAEYDRSDVIVLPSVTKAEAFGLVVLEGMAAGCVPVVSDLPGVRDLVSRAGVIVPPRNMARLRAALLGLARDGTRLDYLSRAARHRAQRLSWDSCVARYERALVDAVAAARPELPMAAPPYRGGDGPAEARRRIATPDTAVRLVDGVRSA